MALAVKNPHANAGDLRDTGLIPGSGRSPEEEKTPTPVFLPRESHGQRSLAATVHRVTKTQTRLKRLNTHTHKVQNHFCLKSKQTKCWWLSCVQLFITPWTIAHQTPLSMAFSRQKYWSGLPFPPPGDLPNCT